MKKILTALCGILIAYSALADVTPPKGVIMGPNPYPKPSFNPGNCSVVVSALPEERMNVIQYIWLEDFNQGLAPTVEKMKQLPVVVFTNVSLADAERIVTNLKFLKCTASFAENKEQTVPNKASQVTSRKLVEPGR